MKKCRTCGESKHELAFAIKRDSSDGLAHECRSCHNDYEKKRRVLARMNRPLRMSESGFNRGQTD
jgi:hypothetical protein